MIRAFGTPSPVDVLDKTVDRRSPENSSASSIHSKPKSSASERPKLLILTVPRSDDSPSVKETDAPFSQDELCQSTAPELSSTRNTLHIRVPNGNLVSTTRNFQSITAVKGIILEIYHIHMGKDDWGILIFRIKNQTMHT